MMLWMCVFMLLTVCVGAIPVLDVHLLITDDGGISIQDVSVREGTPFQSNADLPLQIRMVENEEIFFQESFPVDFVLLTNPPTDRSSIEEHLFIPYRGNKGGVQIMRDEQVLVHYQLQTLCTINKLCVPPENEFTCPEDCAPSLSQKQIPVEEIDWTFVLLIMGILFITVYLIVLVLHKKRYTNRHRKN